MALENLIYYNVSITTSALGGVAPDDGAIDNTKPEGYSAFAVDNLASLRKERGNMRYEELIRQISIEIQPIILNNIIATAADEDTDATTFAFTIAYDRDTYVRTEDEDNLGTFLTDTNAVQRWVARMCIADIVKNRDTYHPDNVGIADQGQIIQEVTAGAIAANLATAEAQITVIIVDQTT